ncbi:hypothetical protein BN946_scf184909.g71 [Trametes cinnabarina]|uniref:Uncharacterized protein n=1 Tax=Pycnoporus cinnabarinus TaxID=5643 RepID=A0A060SAD5_PYCCI|nr:hypothetical protein BN946_scf184909.g71 [Trametes cinnabarina]
MDAPSLDGAAEDHQRTHLSDLRPELEASSSSATAPLKRSALQAFEDVSASDTSRKRLREELDKDKEKATADDVADGGAKVDGGALADNLEEELHIFFVGGERGASVKLSYVGAHVEMQLRSVMDTEWWHKLPGVQDRLYKRLLLPTSPDSGGHPPAPCSGQSSCGEVYDCFDGNTVEVDIMLDYLSAQGLSPRHIYREVRHLRSARPLHIPKLLVKIVAHIQSQPRQFAPLIELELFMDLHPVVGGVDPDPTAPRTRICRMCAAEVLLYGLRDWWIRERKKGFLEEHIMARPDCPEGSQCPRQKDHAHAKEFNHLIAPPDDLEVAPAPVAGPSREPDVGSTAEFPPLPALPLQEPPLRRGFMAIPLPLDIGSPNDLAPAPSSQDFRDEVDALL